MNNKDTNIDISVIIPTYNPALESFLKMFGSVINQTVDNYEIILVDDGSRIENKNTLKEIVYKYPNARMVSQENCGVSSARNTGIELAKGKYITFVDADDYLDKDFFKEAYEEIEKYNADVLFGQICITNPTDISKKITNEDTIVLPEDKLDLAKKSLLGYPTKEMPYIISGSPCGNLYKKELCKKVGFNTEVKYFEDQLFNRKILNEVKKVIVSPKTWYFYLQNDDSAMHNASIDKELWMNLNALLDNMYVVNAQEDKAINNTANNYMIHLWWGILTLAYRKTGYDKLETAKIMKRVSNHHLYDNIFTNKDVAPINVKDRLMLFLTKYVPVRILIVMLVLFKKI